ncbi:MAG: hypothetical protein RR911_01050 [Oscillospiraceae bacterium]
MKNTSLTALGGILTALSVFIMFLSSVLPFLSYTLPALAGLLLLIIVREAEAKWAVMIYVAVSILVFIIVPNKEASIMYIFFFGYYVIVKFTIENKISSPAICWAIKLLIFNISVVLAYIVIIYVFAIPFEEMEEYGVYSVYILLGMGNLTFIVFDYAISKLAILYDNRWHKYFKKIFK